MNQGAYNPVENPLFTADNAMEGDQEDDEDDDLLTELSKPADQQKNPMDRLQEASKPAKKKGIMDLSDSDDEEEFAKRGATNKFAAGGA